MPGLVQEREQREGGGFGVTECGTNHQDNDLVIRQRPWG